MQPSWHMGVEDSDDDDSMSICDILGFYAGLMGPAYLFYPT